MALRASLLEEHAGPGVVGKYNINVRTIVEGGDRETTVKTVVQIGIKGRHGL